MNQHVLVQDLAGFIDGTARAMCRPTNDQDLYYNGYYKMHGIKFQSIMSLLGLIIDWAGPVTINDSDSVLFARSGIYDRLVTLIVTSERGWAHRLRTSERGAAFCACCARLLLVSST